MNIHLSGPQTMIRALHDHIGDEFVTHTIYPKKTKGQAQLQFLVKSPSELKRVRALLEYLQDHPELELV